MTVAGLLAISPMIVIAATIVVLMLLVTVQRNHLLTMLLTLVGLVLAFLAMLFVTPAQSTPVTSPITVSTPIGSNTSASGTRRPLRSVS